jgi:hypothetical protein
VYPDSPTLTTFCSTMSLVPSTLNISNQKLVANFQGELTHDSLAMK